MPRTVAVGLAHSMSETLSPSRSTPSRTPASWRNCSGGYSAPGQVRDASRPLIVVLPFSSRKVASIAISAASASGAAPPYMPECRAIEAVRTVTQTFASPRRLVVRLGTPTAKLPVSMTRIASARSRSGFSGTNFSSPPVPCSSEPSPTILTFTGRSPPSARRAVRWTAMLPLQSAAPRPYQRPFRSVSSQAGLSHAASSAGGWTS